MAQERFHARQLIPFLVCDGGVVAVSLKQWRLLLLCSDSIEEEIKFTLYRDDEIHKNGKSRVRCYITGH